MVDRCSGFPFIHQLHSTTTNAIIRRVMTTFEDFGYAKSILSDNGPQFRTEFGQFCEMNEIIHETSSPYHPRANGLAEAAVKSCKNIIKKYGNMEDIKGALLEFRNTPRVDTGKSPSEIMFGRRQNTLLPVFNPQEHYADVQDVSPKFAIGDNVRIQNPLTKCWDEVGRVTGITRSGRSFIVDTDQSGSIRRNERFIKKIG